MIFIRVVSGLLVGLALLAWSGGAVSAGSAAGPEQAEAPAHGGGGQEDTNPLDFKRDLAIWTAVVFLVLLLLLWKFAWGPLALGLQRREQGIADQIAQAEASHRLAEELLARYEQKLADSQGEVRGILDRARRDAEGAGREILEKTKQEARAEQQRAVQQIDAATANALKELAAQSATLAVELAGKIVGAEISAAHHDRLIEQAVSDFAEEKPGTGGPP
jgi:F-type H+-transporting ATPase subunit b